MNRPEAAAPLTISTEPAVKLFYADAAPLHGAEPENLPSRFVQAKTLIKAALFDNPADANGQAVENDDVLPLAEAKFAICARALAPHAA